MRTIKDMTPEEIIDGVRTGELSSMNFSSFEDYIEWVKRSDDIGKR